MLFERHELGDCSLLFGGWLAFDRGREEDREVEVNCGQPFSLLLAQPCGHTGSPVATLCDPAVITEPLHQRAPGVGDPR